jgi:myo-inositol-1(or 4)-monophosphatase
MPAQSATIRIMIDAARAAAKGLARDFGELENLQVSRKGPSDFVTAADMKAEQVLFESLSKSRPGYGFLMEERGEVVGTDRSHRFIVDPLDGTLNFMHGIPHFAISIGLERQGEIVAGVVMDVAGGLIYWAEKGRGAWMNDRRLRVAARTRLADAVICTGVPFRGKPGHAEFLGELESLTLEVAGIRRFGSAALDLAWVAAGRFDGFWERDLKPWDMAAGLILVQEAGGLVQELDGGKDVLATGSILAANPTLTPLLRQKLKAAKPLGYLRPAS